MIGVAERMIIWTLYVPRKTDALFQQLAVARGRVRSALARDALELYLQHIKRKKAHTA